MRFLPFRLIENGEIDAKVSLSETSKDFVTFVTAYLNYKSIDVGFKIHETIIVFQKGH